MGITFRDGTYVRHIRIGKRTIKEGEFALVWDVYGRCKKCHGPRLVHLWYSTVRFCTKYIANEKQYLVVCHKDGKTVHTAGPRSLYLDHLQHQKIEVRDAIQVNADECLVVYNEVLDEEGALTSEEIEVTPEQKCKQGTLAYEEIKDEIELTPTKKSKPPPVEIKYGPCLFFPNVRQRVETFAWLDHRVTLSLREKRDSVQALCNTKDDHQIEINFSFVWKIGKAEVQKVLSATQNPLSDLSYALKVDVSKNVACQLHDDFIKERDPFKGDTFKNLYEKAADIGVTISQLHYEGYKVCSEILKDRNTLARAEAEEQHRLKAAEEKERLNDFQLEKKMARAEKQAQSNLEEVNQRLQILDREHSAKLDREMNEYRQRLEQEREMALVKTEFLKQLSENGVDLTKYLIAVVGGGRKNLMLKKTSKSNQEEEEVELLERDFFDSSLQQS